MSDKFIVTFDKSAEDIPVLIIAKESCNYWITGGTSINILNTITGDNAVTLYEQLVNKKVEAREANNGSNLDG